MTYSTEYKVTCYVLTNVNVLCTSAIIVYVQVTMASCEYVGVSSVWVCLYCVVLSIVCGCTCVVCMYLNMPISFVHV